MCSELTIIQVEIGSNGTVLILRHSSDESLYAISTLNVLKRNKLLGKVVICPRLDTPSFMNLVVKDSYTLLSSLEFGEILTYFTPMSMSMTAIPSLEQSCQFIRENDQQDYVDSEDGS